MNKRISCFVPILLAILVPISAQARYLNPNTGRFQTMDSYEGSLSEPLSLHKYTYCLADPVDNTDPLGLEVQHAARDLDGVAIGTHQFIILIPDNAADFEGNSPGAKLLQAIDSTLALKNIGGRKVIVIGAHNISSRLTVRFFQKADETATKELLDKTYRDSIPWYQTDFTAEGHIIAAPSGKTDTQFITEILQAVQSYIGNENVSNIPYPKAGLFQGKYNSNSWATSVIRHIGATPWPNFKGADVLHDAQIPDDYFKPGGIKPGAAPRSGSRFNISNTITLPFVVLP